MLCGHLSVFSSPPGRRMCRRPPCLRSVVFIWMAPPVRRHRPEFLHGLVLPMVHSNLQQDKNSRRALYQLEDALRKDCQHFQEQYHVLGLHHLSRSFFQHLPDVDMQRDCRHVFDTAYLTADFSERCPYEYGAFDRLDKWSSLAAA